MQTYMEKMDTTNQITSLFSLHLMSRNHILNSGNSKQIRPGLFPRNQSTQMMVSRIK